MRLEDYFEFIEPNHIRIKGHRIDIQSILNKYLAGQTAEQIAARYDALRLLDVYATITYYLQNRDEVDAYLARVAQLATEDMARSDAQPSAAVLCLRKLREERNVAHT